MKEFRDVLFVFLFLAIGSISIAFYVAISNHNDYVEYMEYLDSDQGQADIREDSRRLCREGMAARRQDDMARYGYVMEDPSGPNCDNY